MIMFLLKHLNAEVCRIRNINKFIKKKKIRRRECPERGCKCRHCGRGRRIRRIRRYRKFRKLGDSERIRRIRRTDIR